MYYTTYPQKLDADANNGFVFTCYTGIAQCAVAVDVLTLLPHSTNSDCMSDPRYLTWRAMTVKYKIDATKMWYRTDSFWNWNSTSFASTMGPGLVMATSPISKADNGCAASAACLGKTFVFAYSDGSGVQLNHITYLSGPPTANMSAGAGTNNLTTARTIFSRDSPERVNENLCGGSDLKLEGTTDTSALSSTITAYSDGYKGTLTLDLEMVLAGAAQGWRGVCMVYYSS